MRTFSPRRAGHVVSAAMTMSLIIAAGPQRSDRQEDLDMCSLADATLHLFSELNPV